MINDWVLLGSKITFLFSNITLSTLIVNNACFLLAPRTANNITLIP